MESCAPNDRRSVVDYEQERLQDFVPDPSLEMEDRNYLHERLITALETIDTERRIARIIMDRLRELDMLQGEAA